MQKVTQKKDWILTPNVFRLFLDWLDEGTDSDGQKYLEMRERLVSFFDRKNCLTPNQLADETLNRVARRLEEEGKIESEAPAKYCYVVARFVFLEYLRTASKNNIPLDEVLINKIQTVDSKAIEETELQEKRLKCLENCLGKLEVENRTMIIRYYYGEERIKIENRRAMAESLGLTMNALSIRACRIRDKIESCVKKCVDGK